MLLLEDIDIGIGESGVSVFVVIPLGGKRSLDEDRTFRSCNSHCKCDYICRCYDNCSCEGKKDKSKKGRLCDCVAHPCGNYVSRRVSRPGAPCHETPCPDYS
ncbi:hypothetical protein HY486_03815 [Candidatus Woesearchaeota archaeon]|nr:hypothetical protein [Candidatus Woesearchaeota archaeon]